MHQEIKFSDLLPIFIHQMNDVVLGCFFCFSFVCVRRGGREGKGIFNICWNISNKKNEIKWIMKWGEEEGGCDGGEGKPKIKKMRVKEVCSNNVLVRRKLSNCWSFKYLSKQKWLLKNSHFKDMNLRDVVIWQPLKESCN